MVSDPLGVALTSASDITISTRSAPPKTSVKNSSSQGTAPAPQRHSEELGAAAVVSAGCFHQAQTMGTFGCKVRQDGKMTENPEKGKRINNKYFSYEFCMLVSCPSHFLLISNNSSVTTLTLEIENSLITCILNV